MFVPVAQVIAEENQMRQDLQMTLDSKDSDIEQLRCQITSLSVHSLDTTSISSGNDLDMGEGYPGRRVLLSSLSRLSTRVPAVSFTFLLSLLSLLFISFSGVWHSAHYSLAHCRINVLHLPAHTEICLHRHPA